MRYLMKMIGKGIVNYCNRTIVPIIGHMFCSRNKYCNVIYYHDIVSGEGYSYMKTNLEVFKRQMEWLSREGYETLRFDDLDEERIRFKKKRILIAFDDGWRSNYDEIFYYMQQRGLKYNIFLTIGEIGANPNYLTWTLVREMYKSGIVGFGTHTFSHPDMSLLAKEEYNKEVFFADSTFEKELGYHPMDFCYPFGFYNNRNNEWMETHSNYQRVYTSDQIYSYDLGKIIIFGRNGISNNDSFSLFVNKVKGYTNFQGVYDNCITKRLFSFYHKMLTR